MVHAHSQKSPQAGPLRIVFGEKILLQKMKEKILSQILGLFVVLVPTQTNVFVNRLPVGRGQHFKRALPFLQHSAPRGHNERPASGWKLALTA